MTDLTDLVPSARLEALVGRVLRTGSTASTTLLLAGLVWTSVSSSNRIGQCLIGAGLLILMATPVGRVMVSCIEYVRERDWQFVVLTATVLLILLGSLVVAITG